MEDENCWLRINQCENLSHDFMQPANMFNLGENTSLSSYTNLGSVDYLLDAIKRGPDSKAETIYELLYQFGMVGYGVSIERTQASNINPWQIKIRHVSTKIVDSVSSMCALDSGIALKT
eukprot:UN18442